MITLTRHRYSSRDFDSDRQHVRSSKETFLSLMHYLDAAHCIIYACEDYMRKRISVIMQHAI